MKGKNLSMHYDRTAKIAIGGLLTAAVLLMTFLIKIPVPATGGYVHPGDGIIFVAALLLGPSAGLVAGLGSALADVLGGYLVYALPTFIIKAAMGAMAGLLARKGALLRNALVFLLAECIMAIGYFLFETVAFGLTVAITALGPNALQAAVGILLGISLTSLPLDILS